MVIPRIVHKVYAHIFGFFWLQCPNCGRWRGGHEKQGGTIWETWTETGRKGTMLCANCPGEAYRAPTPTVRAGGQIVGDGTARAIQDAYWEHQR